MKQATLTVKNNRALTHDVYELTLSGADRHAAGQFVELAVDGFYLRRPISVADSEGDTLTLLIKKVGQGTAKLGTLAAGDKVDVLTGLGNAFDLSAKKPLLVGGGIGCAPLYALAKSFAAAGVRPTVVLGFRSQCDVYYADEFSRFGDVVIATDDGTRDIKGNALTAIKEKNIDFDRFYACGPTVMLRALCAAFPNGQVSLEARMGCGFGACMGCSIKTTNGFKRVCKEGPVFEAAEVIWE